MISTEFKLKTPAIIELVEPLKVIMDKLGDNLKDQVYGAIISEGASACIPGYILQKAINMVYYNQGLDGIPHVHLGRHRRPDDFARIRGNLKNDPECINLSSLNKKALLVTEYMASGRRLEEAGLILHEFGIKFDVATLFATQEDGWYKYIIGCFHEGGAELFVGYKYSTEVSLRCDFAGGRIPAPSISHNDRLNIQVWGCLDGGDLENQEVRELVPLVRKDIDEASKLIVKDLNIVQGG